jgi:large subunit ribosomal protein L13Ae
LAACPQVVVVDCRDHLMGRLASILAKQLLEGQHVVCVRTEELCISGGYKRQLMKLDRWAWIHTNTRPNHGPFHYRTPSQFFWRVVRGMLPHKTKRGKAALGRLKGYEGIPPPYDKVKRAVVPDALRVLRLQRHHKYVTVGKLLKERGWKHSQTVQRLEAQRKEESKKHYERKRAQEAERKAAEKRAEAELAPLRDTLALATGEPHQR